MGIAGGTGSGKTTLARKIVSSLPAGARGRPPARLVLPRPKPPVGRGAGARELRRAGCPRQRAAPRRSRDAAGWARRRMPPLRLRVAHAPRRGAAPSRRTRSSRGGNPPLRDSRAARRIRLRVFVDTDDDIRLLRRIRRDIEERGRDIASIEHQYEGFRAAHASAARGPEPAVCPPHRSRGRREHAGARRDRGPAAATCSAPDGSSPSRHHSSVTWGPRAC